MASMQFVDAAPHAAQSLLNATSIEAIVIAALALMFATVAWRTRETGMPTLACGFALAAAWYFTSDRIPATGPDIDTLAQHVGAIAIGLAVVLVALGVIRHLGWPQGALRLLAAACLAPAIVLLALLAVGVDIPHLVFHVGVMPAYVGAALTAFGHARAEGGARLDPAHFALGLALLTLATLPFLMMAMQVDPLQLKYLAGVALAVFGVFLLAVTLLRRHHALLAEVRLRADAEGRLRDANGRLEARVGERTAHLHELISGLEDFSRGVSHDLRGPLGGMAQLAQQAAEALAEGDRTLAERALPAIAQQCETSARMVGAMLDLARLGDATVRRQWLDPAELARAAFDEVMLSWRGGARPVFRCAAMPRVLTDPDLLRPVFVNLLANAVKFTRDTRGALIDVEARVEGRDVAFSVRDNGAGFAPEAARRLFEPFFRAHGAQYEGHGLGLSIVRRAVQALGGQVWAEPGPQGGAHLCFRLHGAAPPEPAAAVPPPALPVVSVAEVQTAS